MNFGNGLKIMKLKQLKNNIMKRILFKWQLGKEYKIFDTKEELIKELRKEENECSDDFIVNLSYELGEWRYID